MKKVRYVQMTYTRLFRIETDSDKEASDAVLDGKGTPVTDYKPMRADVLANPPEVRIDTTETSGWAIPWE